MSDVTKIQWTDHTSSPWHGCTKIAPGCENCYAERQSVRNPGILGIWGDDGVRVKSKSFIKNLEVWNKEGERRGEPVKVFPSICDPFEDRPELVDWRNEMFAAADRLPWIVLQLLTKRPENVPKMWPAFFPGGYIAEAGEMNCEGPRPNVWIGTSVSDQETADRNIPLLLKCRELSAVLFLSCEPLLGSIRLDQIQHDGIVEIDCLTGNHGLHRPLAGRSNNAIDWVIVGGESGPGSRMLRVEWDRKIVQQCKSAGVPCFNKQLGAFVVDRNDSFGYADADWNESDDQQVEYHIHGFREDYQGADCRIRLRDKKGGDISEWPADLRVRQFPKYPVGQSVGSGE